jgi:hypothetical protein
MHVGRCQVFLKVPHQVVAGIMHTMTVLCLLQCFGRCAGTSALVDLDGVSFSMICGFKASSSCTILEGTKSRSAVADSAHCVTLCCAVDG